MAVGSEAASLAAQVEEALGVPLSAADRMLLGLRLGWGLGRSSTQAEVAAALGVNQTWVSKRERELRSKLRRVLDERSRGRLTG